MGDVVGQNTNKKREWKRKSSEETEMERKELIMPLTVIGWMDRKRIPNSLPNKFLIPSFKI